MRPPLGHDRYYIVAKIGSQFFGKNPLQELSGNSTLLPKKAVYMGQQSSYSRGKPSKNIRNIFLKQVPIQKLSSPHCDEMEGREKSGGADEGRQPLNPGAGPAPAPVALPEAFGGNRRLYTAAAPAADRLCPIPVHGCPIPVHGCPPVHDYRCNLQCILRVVFKKHRFLQGFVAFAVSGFHLGDVKKPWVFHGFGS